MKRILLLLFLLLVVSCKKKPVHKVNQEFVGHWTHRTAAQEYMYFTINSDSRGWLDIYDAAGKQKAGDQSRRWLIKKNNLYFGWLGIGEEKFHIDRYPGAAAAEIIYGADTIPAGKTYMILDGNYYRRYE